MPRTTCQALLIFLSIIAATLSACSDPNDLLILNPETGKHIGNWHADHPAAYRANPGLCSECHGTDLKGGISGVSCFSSEFEGMSCHANGPSGHSVTWAAPDEHGANAKAAPDTSQGIASCRKCHGGNYAGGEVQKTCLNTAGCHGEGVQAPHSPAPWMGGTRTHTTTDPGNAPACALCHLYDRTPPSYASAPSGVQPNCFNNTLCHGTVGHEEGWANPDAHGSSAKAALGESTGFASCKTCHGADFTGGDAQQTCLNTAGCHGASVGAPHSPAPWRGGSRTHTATDQSNAPVCALCHLNKRTPPSFSAVPDGTQPGCFNSTLCHGPEGHAADWSNPDKHGATAKAAASSSAGFASCQTCHGSDFKGGTVQQTCLNTTGCHGAGVQSPHPAAPWRSVTRTHTTTDQSNAPVCSLCHVNGANSSVKPSSTAPPGTAPGCFNNTLCHATPGHGSGWSDPTQHGASAKAAPNSVAMQGFSTCETCHGTDFSGGAANKACAPCHGGSAPHPTAWLPGDTYIHTTTNEGNASVCAQCHANGANSPIPAPSPPAPGGTAPGCFNSTLCHGQAGHTTGWSAPAQHGASAKAAPDSATMQGFNTCSSCHGHDFSGGIANTACASCHGGSAPHPAAWLPGDPYIHTTTDQGNASVCALCHLNNRTPPSYAAVPNGTNPGCFNNTLCHGNVGAPHAVPFTDAALHGPAAKADLTYCQSCHSDKPAGGPGSNPRFNIPKGNLAEGCETSGCHNAYMAHPTPWRGLKTNDTGHMTAGNMANACALCHGATLVEGGVGRACTSCHTAGSPLTKTNCTSCHGAPPDGATSPNVAGKHPQHTALGAYIVCNSCHTGAGTGTASHYNSTVNVSISSTYNAKSGTASFNATGNTCNKISCHGGQTTPNWLTGSIDVNDTTQCTLCHSSGTTEYNGYYSGRHSTHLSRGYTCTDCHDTTLLAVNHFTHLNTSTMEGPASSTIKSSLNYNGTSCNPSCHGTKNW